MGVARHPRPGRDRRRADRHAARPGTRCQRGNPPHAGHLVQRGHQGDRAQPVLYAVDGRLHVRGVRSGSAGLVGTEVHLSGAGVAAGQRKHHPERVSIGLGRRFRLIMCNVSSLNRTHEAYRTSLEL